MTQDEGLALRFTPRLLLRRPVMADVAAYFAIFGDPATQRFNPSGPCASPAEAQADMAARIAHWERTGHGSWAVCLRERPQEVVGFGGLSTKDFGGTHRANLGYRFAVSTWGRGLATELAQASLQAAWHDLGVDAVWATVRAPHAASRRVLEKVGFVAVQEVDDPRIGAPPSVWYAVQRPDATGIEA